MEGNLVSNVTNLFFKFIYIIYLRFFFSIQLNECQANKGLSPRQR